MIERREKVVAQLRDGIAGLLKKAGVTVVEGMAVFKDEFTVTVGVEEYNAEHIIIATGSESKSLPVPGADAEWVLDSTDILRLEYVPARLVIVGSSLHLSSMPSVLRSLSSSS